MPTSAFSYIVFGNLEVLLGVASRSWWHGAFYPTQPRYRIVLITLKGKLSPCWRPGAGPTRLIPLFLCLFYSIHVFTSTVSRSAISPGSYSRAPECRPAPSRLLYRSKSLTAGIRVLSHWRPSVLKYAAFILRFTFFQVLLLFTTREAD